MDEVRRYIQLDTTAASWHRVYHKDCENKFKLLDLGVSF